MTRYGQALAAFIRGCNTSEDIADELKISKAHASYLVTQLRKDGFIRWTGRQSPKRPCSRKIFGKHTARFNARTPFVYELVSENKGCTRSEQSLYARNVTCPTSL